MSKQRASYTAKTPSHRPLAIVRRDLLRWYDRNRRQLPWRKSPDPYRVWISEVMLQQTRVQTVIPYYRKFLRLFPNMRSLAAAKEETLLACWSGLGYYSRARNLHKAAQQIVQEFGGGFPTDFDAARRLPGVGDYTARAVLSIAYGIPLAVLDGNVARVLSRLEAVAADPRSNSGKKRLLERAEALLSRRRPGDFNQAMMELGATVCLPRQPRCPLCPLRRGCRAYSRNQVENYPPRGRKEGSILRRLAVAVLLDRRRCLLVRRPASSKRLAGFWELPNWEISEPKKPTEPKRGSLAPSLTNGMVLENLLGHVKHSIVTNRLEVAVYQARLAPRAPAPDGKWVSLSQVSRFPITTITRKALALVR